MESREGSRPRRPLPVPGATRASPAQRPNTPVTDPIPASSFYSAGTQQISRAPNRLENLGSSHTTTHFSNPEPPTYDNTWQDPRDYREPELVSAQDDDDGSAPPPTVPNTDEGWPPTHDDWGQNFDMNGWSNASGSGWDDSTTGYYSSKSAVDVPINGRQDYEERHWWDPDVRARSHRPGPGILPPILSEELHNSDHSLFSISVTPPDSHLTRQPSENPGTASPAPSGTSHYALHTIPPSEEEVRTSVPHPNAYYCSRENGWVILSWKSSSITPPLAQSFENSDHPPLPDQAWRKQTTSCVGDTDRGQVNKTHHFHKYAEAIDALKLTPPFKVEDWDAEVARAKRHMGASDGHKKDSATEHEDLQSIPEEGILLDLYVCCQCSFYCVASSLIPGVIPRKHLDEFIRDKRSNPPVGRTGEQAVIIALETILLALENVLWKGEVRALKVVSRSNTFQAKVGWNPNTKHIFDILGFTEEQTGDELRLSPPIINNATLHSRIMRRKLLRAWVEMGAWLADFRRKYNSHLRDIKMRELHVKIDNAREMYQLAISAHPDQIPRNDLSMPLTVVLQPLEESWAALGLTLKTYSPDYLTFAYLAQCRCDPTNTVLYFSHLTNIVRAMESSGEPSTQLQDLLISEHSRDRFTTEDLVNAASILGFGMDRDLGVELDDEVEDDFIENAWREAIKKSWKDVEHGSALQREANDAFRIIAEARGSVKLRNAWQTGRNSMMSPDRAYKVLEVPETVDDNMLITIFSMRIEERPTQLDKMREALGVIAEIRDSERLRQFLLSGQDPGDVKVAVSPDFPRGLNQLGNTCYLNSLLQYFYTIKDLREAVMSTSKLDMPVEDEKLTDDDLKRHRVGGRLVTRREIIRSKKFLTQLADLFSNLEYCDAAAVTPTIELAKLALITSRDEEDEEFEKGGTDSSNDTDATLVDDGVSQPSLTGPSHEAPRSPPQSPNSILGKRARDDKKVTEMDVDSPIVESPGDKEGYVLVSSPSRNSVLPRPLEKLPSGQSSDPSSSKLRSLQQDVEMQDAVASQKPPPLPPRKRTEPSNSDMMFGKQHDVAECMDNCVFQIETALLKFNGEGSQGKAMEKTSVVKRLFFGTIKQRLTGITDVRQSRASVHDKTDLFSHLPVNVADDGIDIYDGLSGYFDDIVEFQGRKTRMEMSLVDLPPLLQIQLQRVQFNRETLQPYKSQAYVKFWENIYLDRFMDDVELQKKAKSKALQSELNTCRERLRVLIEGKNSPFTTSMNEAISFLSRLENGSEIGVDDDLLFNLNNEKTHISEEVEQLRGRARRLKDELENLWSSSTNVEYELTSVFIHRGSSPSWGHYFFYSRNLPDDPDSWFKYNDSDVSVVSKDEVLADTTGSTANPYLLVFARKGSNVVDTVKRFRPSDIETN